MRATLRHPTGKPSRRNRVDRRVPRRPIRSGSGVELSTEELALSPGWGKAPGVPVEWQRSTMAHLCSVYPFHADVGFGHRGVLLGTNVTAGMSGFYFDPFEFYAQRHLTNPNMIVMGSVGYGKSATVKAFIRRLKAVYGADRYLAVIDPKGEYGAVAADLGLAVVKLHPGGSDRINPMEIVGGDADGAVVARQQLATQLVAGVLDRPLSAIEDAVLGWAIERRSQSTGLLAFTLRDLCAEVSDPPDELVRLSRHSPLELARATAPVAFALDKLCSRTLRGMFDGQTSIDIDWNTGPGIVLDLSAVYANSEALPLVISAATHWLSSALRERPQRRSVQVIDEAWAAVRHGAGYFQSSLKLSRAHGVATVLVCHRPSDLTAQADDGTSSAKIAAGLLSDIQTRVLLRQPPEQIPAAAELFDLTERERQWLGQLVPGRAIWHIGQRSAVVQVQLTANERQLFDTDQRMHDEVVPAEVSDGCD
jgi:type IV secretory pathway VirB4 component